MYGLQPAATGGIVRGGKVMDYRAAYEALSKAIWAYDKAHENAYIIMMLKIRRIENNLDVNQPPIEFKKPPNNEK